MKNSWPKVTCSVQQTVIASHSLPSIGFAPTHQHSYVIRAGWTHEINPSMGCTKSMQEMEKDLAELTAAIDGSYLNDLLPFPPTAEILACWIMARLPAYWQFVEIDCYDGYKVRVQADSMRSEWAEKFR